MRAVCRVCPHHCSLEEGKTGLCRARENRGGVILSGSYGRITGMALDPIEKKPLNRFCPGSRILSVGSYGCNLRCPFCQNHEISMKGGDEAEWAELSPEELAEKAEELRLYGNIGVAYTYNEPCIGYEYVRDAALLVRKKGMKNVLVTNGFAELWVLEELLPWIDAMNVDLKGFTEAYYRKLGGDLETVKAFIRKAASACHIEVTTLIVPGENDGDELEELAAWVALVRRDIPLHLTRFFPRWKMSDKSPTPVSTIDRAVRSAEKYLKYVYKGNC